MKASKKGEKKDRSRPESTEDVDIEKLLRGLKYIHPDDNTMAEYFKGGMEDVGKAIVETHLRLCMICERRLKFLKDEKEFVDNYEITDEDRAANRRFMQEFFGKKKE
jgi:hypothetical protein